jgi:cystathionine beta-synthase
MVGRQPGILNDALGAVGNTPLIRLNKIPQEYGIQCNVLVKCEYFNAGGSVKDRIAARMLDEAEQQGLVTPGKTVIIEPTSGNTGVGLALACAVKGYRCIIVLPEKMSAEKVATLKALGAEVIRTPTEAAWDDPRSNIMTARRLAEETENAYILDQYNNPNNPLAHRVTAQEIIDDVTAVSANQAPLTPSSSPRHHVTNLNTSSGKVDVLVAGVGTGGTVSGIATRLRESDHNPDLFVLGVDPIGSTLAVPASLNELENGESGAYKIEGIGYDFDPKSLDKQQVSSWIKTHDDESFDYARKLIRMEGLLCGGSSGAALAGAMRFLKQGGEGYESFGSQQGKNVVIILPDSLRNYITKPWLVEGTKEEQHIA